MASSFTTRLNLEKVTTGEQPDSWGTTEQANQDLLDKAIAGVLAKSVAGATNVTLTTAEADNKHIELTGAITANIDVIFPAKERVRLVHNNTSGSFTITLKCSGQPGFVLTQGKKAIVVCDGTDVSSYLDDESVGAVVAIAQGGTGATTAAAARAALDVVATAVVAAKQADVITTRGDLIRGSAVGAAERTALGAATTYLRSNGADAAWSAILAGDLPLAGDAAVGGLETATQAEMEAATAVNKIVTPGRQQFHPGMAKAWVNFTGEGAVAIQESYNASGITDHGVGQYTVNWSITMATTTYAWLGMSARWVAAYAVGAGDMSQATTVPATTSTRVHTTQGAGTVEDARFACVAIFGDI